MKISIIIPTLNEGAHLGQTIVQLRQTAVPGSIEVVVVDAQSRDSTLTIAHELADKILISDTPGRGRQMNQGALAGSGDIFLFLHADSHLPHNWQTALLEANTSRFPPTATAFKLKFGTNQWRYRFITWGAHLRGRLTGIPHGDQGIAVRREVYFQAGGFPAVPLMEEYYLGRKLRRMGKIKILPEAIVTSTRRYTRNGPFFNALRNSLIIFLYYLGVRPTFLSKIYYWTRAKTK